MVNEQVSNKELYEAIGDLRKEIISSVQRLEDRFMNLETGRLATLEAKVANQEGKIYVFASVISIVLAGAVSYLSKALLH